MDEKPFELFCIENDFTKYLAKFCNLFVEIFCFRNYANTSK